MVATVAMLEENPAKQFGGWLVIIDRHSGNIEVSHLGKANRKEKRAAVGWVYSMLNAMGHTTSRNAVWIAVWE